MQINITKYFLRTQMRFARLGLRSTDYRLQTNQGQAVIIAVVFLMSTMIILTGSFGTLALRQAKIVRAAGYSAQSYFLAEAGIEDAIYRVLTGKKISNTETLTSGDTVVTTDITNTVNGWEIRAKGETVTHVRIIEAELSSGNEIQLNYGVHIGEGGFEIANNALVEGNVFSNGPVVGSNDNEIKGVVVSAGSLGLVSGIHATSSTYAHTIDDSFIEGDAYYEIIDSGTTVLGTKHPGSKDISTIDLVIPEETLDEWESVAEAGGVISSPCPYVIDDEAVTIGPVKINCDLVIQGTSNVTIAGMIWVVGNVVIKNFASVNAVSSPVDKSYAIIADNPADKLNGSTVKITNHSNFSGFGEGVSYIMLVSRNESVSNGGVVRAIEMSNQVDAGDLILYASKGEILIQNNGILREVSAYKVHIRNNVIVRYETGLAHILFDTGPEGGYDILDWKEVE